MSLGPFGLLMMKSLNVAVIFNEAVLENSALMKTLASLLHSKSFYLLCVYACVVGIFFPQFLFSVAFALHDLPTSCRFAFHKIVALPLLQKKFKISLNVMVVHALRYLLQMPMLTLSDQLMIFRYNTGILICSVLCCY